MKLQQQPQQLSHYNGNRNSNHQRQQYVFFFVLLLVNVIFLGDNNSSNNNSYSTVYAALSAPQGDGNSTYNNVNVLIEQANVGYAILFPWFIQITGVFIFFLLTRYESIQFIPFQSIMFIIGAISGYVSTIRYNAILENYNITETTSEDSEIYNTLSLSDELDQLSISILQWSTIDSVVLLLVFLPGLIFRDAIEVNFHLFYQAINQLLLLAFPLVLVGAAMISGVGKYILHEYLPLPSPQSSSYYNWPISLWMVLGSILSSTDPIAVGSLLKKAKAPPRLQMHISGESLINDGSALVFYVIFTKQYIADLGFADHVTLSEGVLLFLRMAFGGLTVGTCFAFGLCYVLHIMDTRLEPEYNIIQVVAALSIAYISYYVAEQVCNMSGIIACVSCGIVTRAIGKGLIREHHLMDSYLALMEHLLNTLLFALGGVVWGKAVADGEFGGLAWFHLIIFYVAVTLIRFVQVGMFYPIFSRIGLKSDWKEAMFLAYGGIRGSVGIAFAIALKGQILPLTDSTETNLELTLLNFYAGGITLMTLLINASTAGPMLRKLGLTKPGVSRKQAIKLFESSAKSYINKEYAILKSQARFAKTRFQIIKAHVPFIVKPSKAAALLTDRKQIPSSRRGLANGTIHESQHTLNSHSEDQASEMSGVPSFLYKKRATSRGGMNSRQLSTPVIGSDFFSKASSKDIHQDQHPTEIDIVKPASNTNTNITDDNNYTDDQLHTGSNHSSKNRSTRATRNTRQLSTPSIGANFFTTSKQDIDDNNRMSRVIDGLSGRGAVAQESHRTIDTNVSSDRLQPYSERSTSSNQGSTSTRNIRVRQKSAPSIGSDFFMKREKEDSDKDEFIKRDDKYEPSIDQQHTDTIEPSPTYETDDEAMRHSHHLSRMLTVRSLGSQEQIVELRHFFLELLDQAYCDELELGEIDEGQENEGLNADILRESVALARRAVDNNEPIQDWEFAKYDRDLVIDLSVSHWLEYLFVSKEDRIRAMNYQHRRNNVLRTLAFIEAHERAQEKLKALLSSTARATGGQTTSVDIPPDIVENQTDDENADKVSHDGVDDVERTPSTRSSGTLDAAIARVLMESTGQVKLARNELASIPKPEIQRITSHYLCTILLHKLIDFVGENIIDGLISRKEGMLYFRQIDRCLRQSYTCTHDHIVEVEDPTNASLLGRIEQHNSNRAIGNDNNSNRVPAVSAASVAAAVATTGTNPAATNDSVRSQNGIPKQPTLPPEKVAAARVTAVMDAYFHNFKK